MPKFIKLIDYHTNDVGYVNIDMIIVMIRLEDKTHLSVVDVDNSAIVKETPEAFPL